MLNPGSSSSFREEAVRQLVVHGQEGRLEHVLAGFTKILKTDSVQELLANLPKFRHDFFSKIIDDVEVGLCCGKRELLFRQTWSKFLKKLGEQRDFCLKIAAGGNEYGKVRKRKVLNMLWGVVMQPATGPIPVELARLKNHALEISDDIELLMPSEIRKLSDGGDTGRDAKRAKSLLEERKQKIEKAFGDRNLLDFSDWMCTSPWTCMDLLRLAKTQAIFVHDEFLRT